VRAADAQRYAALSLHVNDIPEFEDARRTAEHEHMNMNISLLPRKAGGIIL
jgi:hypothetical protein